MKTPAIAILAALFLSAAFAEDAKPAVAPEGAKPQAAAEGAKPTVSRHLTPEQRRARQAQMMMRRYGGMVRKAGSAQGKVLFLDAQKRVGKDALKEAFNVIEERIHPIWEYKPAEAAKARDVGAAMKEAGAAVGVALVDDEGGTTLLVAPEAGWATVNVAALDDGCGAEALAHRVRVEILRAFALVGGGAFMQRDPIVMRNDIMKPSDLDMIKEENYGIDVAYAISAGLPQRGVMPWHETTYKKACEQGWAPAPTNDVQKAIWDKVHAVPATPMKIEFDPKKGR